MIYRVRRLQFRAMLKATVFLVKTLTFLLFWMISKLMERP
jgi:hypothetical protein